LHGIAHLIRYCFSSVKSDINGVNNSLRTLEEIETANTNRIQGRQSVQPIPGRPFQRGVTPVRRAEITLAQRASMRQTGLRVQDRNSAGRVNPLTRFCCSLNQTWRDNTTNIVHNNISLGGRVEDHKVTNIGARLDSLRPLNIPLTRFHVFSEIFRGEKRIRHGWELLSYSLPLPNGELPPLVSYPTFGGTLNANFTRIYTPFEVIQRYNFLAELNSNAETTAGVFLSSFPNEEAFHYYYYFYEQRVNETYFS
jgi:hypothetical protein